MIINFNIITFLYLTNVLGGIYLIVQCHILSIRGFIQLCRSLGRNRKSEKVIEKMIEKKEKKREIKEREFVKQKKKRIR